MTTDSTKRFAILGYPVEHSLSPKIHNTVFQSLNLPYSYEKIAIELSEFQQEIINLKKSNWAGFNITVPFKSQIISYLDSIDPVASQIGAINTVKVDNDGTWKGFNTDYIGFLRALPDKGCDIHSCLIIGAGGAARAVAFGILSKLKIERIVILNRSQERADRLIADLQKIGHIPAHAYCFNDKLEGSFDLIVNATVLGLEGSAEPFPLNPNELAHPRTIVYDLIYKPMPTPFLRLASEENLTIINGWPMLVYQAEEAFKIWTGDHFPEAVRNKLLQEY